MDFVNLVATYGVGVVAALAFIVNVVVELTKNVGFLKKVPTDLYVTIISIIITCAAYFTAAGIFAHQVVWYEVILVPFAGFIVAYVAMYGWTKIKELWEKFNNK